MKRRNTRQKQILGEELDRITTFFSADELLSAAKKKDSSIGIATVYRYLRELNEQKVLFTYMCDRRAVYSKEMKSHCHFTCEKTGKTVHFDIDSLDFLKKKIPGKITSFQIEVKGICNECD